MTPGVPVVSVFTVRQFSLCLSHPLWMLHREKFENNKVLDRKGGDLRVKNGGGATPETGLRLPFPPAARCHAGLVAPPPFSESLDKFQNMNWQLSNRADTDALPLADRHYNRQKVGSPQFVPPGRCIVLLTSNADALWVSSWPEYVQHEWAGAWTNSLFRNESPTLASALITEAVAITRFVWGEPPELGMITFIDREKIRHKRDPGRCYLKAGFKQRGYTKGGLLTLGIWPCDMPAPLEPIGRFGQLTLTGHRE